MAAKREGAKVVRPVRAHYCVSMRLLLSLVAASLCAMSVQASPRIAIPGALRQSVLACLGEALRLCPNALAEKDHGVSCILGKRRLLTAPCRVLSDQGVRFLNGQDVHMTLRRPATPGSPVPPR